MQTRSTWWLKWKNSRFGLPNELTKYLLYVSTLVWSPLYKSACSKCWSYSLWKNRMTQQAPSLARLLRCLVCQTHQEQGADAVQILLYYDVDSADELNRKKRSHRRDSYRCVAKTFHSSLKSSLTMSADAGFWNTQSETTQVIGAMKCTQTRASTSMSWKWVPVNVKYVEALAMVKSCMYSWKT